MHRWPDASAHCAVSSRRKRPPVAVPMVLTQCGRKHPPEKRLEEFNLLHALHVAEGSTEIWTDGSQRTSAFGAYAVFSPGRSEPDLKRGFSLPFYVSSTWSELHAIHQALLATPPTLRDGPLWIFTDSQSAILAICSKTAFCDEVVYNILQCIRGMQQRSLVVKFMHIPAHSGVPRNQRVDSMAAVHSSLPTSSPVPAAMPISVFQGMIRKCAFAEWAQQQESATAKLYLHEFAQHTAPLRVHRSLTRLQSIVLSQLRCGRSPVVGDLQRRVLDGDPADVPRCKCGVEVNWQHLLSCPLLAHWRPAQLTLVASDVDAGSSHVVVDTAVALCSDEHFAPASQTASSSQAVVVPSVALCLDEHSEPAASTASFSQAVVVPSVPLSLDETFALAASTEVASHAVVGSTDGHPAPASLTASASQAVVVPSVALCLDERSEASASSLPLSL
eukprot:3717838-Amphidinium_carterae.1